ncbi:hypothetical protein RQP46_004309 [Phenoliferia psychrophenolica]
MLLLTSLRSAVCSPRKLPPALAQLGLTPAELLASRYLLSANLKAYAEWQGFEYTTGKFTLDEIRELRAAVEDEAQKLAMKAQDAVFLRNGEKGVDTNAMWTAVATRLPMRPQAIQLTTNV